MATFLNTTATNYHLEGLIRAAKERLVIVSPYLKFNDRFKALLEDQDRMRIDIRIVYGKSELAPAEINWLSSLESVRTSFLQNLHAKCYLSENAAIITSMNLYEFSQLNNDEMGVYILRDEEPGLYADAYEEVQRLLRGSQQVRLAADQVDDSTSRASAPQDPAYQKLTTSALAKLHGTTTKDLTSKIIAAGLLTAQGQKFQLTSAGKAAGGESRVSKQHGQYFLWPKDLNP